MKNKIKFPKRGKEGSGGAYTESYCLGGWRMNVYGGLTRERDVLLFLKQSY